MQLQKRSQEIENQGFQIVALSPDRPSKSQKLQKKVPSIQLLSDSDMTAARHFGVAYQVSKKTRKALAGFGIDLEKSSGRDHHQLPVPAVFLISKESKILFTHANPNYKSRLHPKILQAALEVYSPKKD